MRNKCFIGSANPEPFLLHVNQLFGPRNPNICIFLTVVCFKIQDRYEKSFVVLQLVCVCCKVLAQRLCKWTCFTPSECQTGIEKEIVYILATRRWLFLPSCFPITWETWPILNGCLLALEEGPRRAQWTLVYNLITAGLPSSTVFHITQHYLQRHSCTARNGTTKKQLWHLHHWNLLYIWMISAVWMKWVVAIKNRIITESSCVQ